eukprot:257937-Chlamydomonas_euryale.AAC.6
MHATCMHLHATKTDRTASLYFPPSRLAECADFRDACTSLRGYWRCVGVWGGGRRGHSPTRTWPSAVFVMVTRSPLQNFGHIGNFRFQHDAAYVLAVHGPLA